MYNFNARIKKLRAAIGELPNKFKITFADGSTKIAENTGEAINICCYDRNAVKVEEIGEPTQDNFIGILQALIETDPDELWAEHGDEPI